MGVVLRDLVYQFVLQILPQLGVGVHELIFPLDLLRD